MIGGTLEYLMSSLPHLTFHNTAEAQERVLGLLRSYGGPTTDTLSPTQILDEEAQKFLSPTAFSVFQRMNLKNIHQPEFREADIPLLAAYSAFSLEFKVAIREWRTPSNEGDHKAANEQLTALISTGNPLEKELRIMQHQWATLEALSAGHFADVTALFTYKIKLLILLRWWSFDREKGFQRFLKMTENT